MKSFFPNPFSQLPVLMRDGNVTLLPWGRRHEQKGSLPIGGWARLDSIYAGRWDKYFPKPVKLPVLRYMEKDYTGKSHWYDLMDRQFIQGLLAKDGNELRVYVVTCEANIVDRDFHDRTPRVMGGATPQSVLVSPMELG